MNTKINVALIIGYFLTSLQVSFGQVNLDVEGETILRGKTTIDDVFSLGNPFDMKTSITDSWMGIYNSNGYRGYMGIYTANDDLDFGTGGGNGTGKTHLVTQATPRLTVDGLGNVGVGTQSPTAKFEVNRSDAGQVMRLTPLVNNGDLVAGDGDFRIGSTANHLEMGVSLNGADAGTSRIQADGIANTGVLALGSNDLDIVTLSRNSGGTARVDFDFNEANTMYIEHTTIDWAIRGTSFETGVIGNSINPLWWITSRSFSAADVANYGAYSDKRIKENIVDMKNGIELINQIRPVSYDIKREHYYQGTRQKSDKDRKDRMGFIAQELETVFPTLVHYDSEADIHSVGYMGLIPVMTKAIQELSKENNELKERLAKVEAAIEAMSKE